ncbi:MAG: type II toxin-antitoxin system PemK/MazF family toxin [Gammaproteobacteria bacterium]|nr:MAG: type II toxin-antitoxin system PemK/MazF family toxin [Gammaproteobacteria bacterium]
MTLYEFGDVVLIPFPFTNQSATKKRPAVVVSSRIYNVERPDLVVMAITSQTRAANRFDIPVNNWREAGLLMPSVIKPVLATIERALVLRRLGQLKDEDCQTLTEKLKGILGKPA